MDANKLRVGHKVMIDDQPYIVVSVLLRQQPRLATKMITKMKHLITGAVMEKTFTGGDNVPEADVANMKAQYLYSDGENFYFMINDTFEQVEFSKEKIGDLASFLIEGVEVSIMQWNGNPINIDMPPSVTLLVTEAEPGVKGDSATGRMKKATLETGVIVDVPLFIEAGERIVVDPLTGEYKSREKE